MAPRSPFPRFVGLLVLLAICRFSCLFPFSTTPFLVIDAAGTPRSNDPAHRITIGVVQVLVEGNVTGTARNAQEVYAGYQLAIEDINSNLFETSYGIHILDGYTLELDLRNTFYDMVQSAHVTTMLLDPLHNPSPPPIVIGTLGYDEANGALIASQPYQTPVLSAFVSAPSLTSMFPNFNRYCDTDQMEGIALLTLINSFKWKKVAFLYNNDGSTSTQLPTLMTQFSSMIPDLQVFLYPYTYAGLGAPDLSQQFNAIKAAEVRIILLSESSFNVAEIMIEAERNGMIGKPYAWIGSSQWCYDETLFDNPRASHLLNGIVCTRNHLDTDSAYFQTFQQRWTEKYRADPASMYYIDTPTVGASGYDSVIGVALAMQQLIELKRECNISVTGDNGRPLSGLIPPNFEQFTRNDYQGDGGGIVGNTIIFSQSLAPTTAPDVCPWLLYQVGQGRVLNMLLRNQHFTASTGPIHMIQTGDRIGDLSIMNFYDGQLSLIGTINVPRMMAQFQGISAMGNYTEVFEQIAQNQMNNVSDEWRNYHNASTFDMRFSYEEAQIPLVLRPTGELSSNIFDDYDGKSIRWVDGTNAVPLDSPRKVVVIEGVSSSAQIAILVLTAIVMVYDLLLLAFQVRYRKEKLIKMTSPSMNITFLIGALGILTYIILLGFDSTQLGGESGYKQLCHVKFALLAMSFSVSFGSLFAKTYRLDAIFNSKHLHVRAVRDRDILLIVVLLVAIDIIILVVWQGANPFYRSLSQDLPTPHADDINQLDIMSREKCSSENFTIYVATFLSYKGALLAFGLYLAVRIRRINIPNLNDSKFIVMAIYNVVLVSILLIVISLVLSDQPDAFYLIVAIGLLYISTMVLSLLFLPRVLALLWNYDFSSDSSTSGPTGTSKQQHANTSSENNALRDENARLRLKLQNVQHEMVEVRKAAHAAGMDMKVFQRPSSNGIANSPAAGGATLANRQSPHLRPSVNNSLHMRPSPKLQPRDGGSLQMVESRRASHSALAGITASPAIEPVRIHFHLGGGEEEATKQFNPSHHRPASSTHFLSAGEDPSIVKIVDPHHIASPSATSPNAGVSSPLSLTKKLARPIDVRASAGLPGRTTYNSQIGDGNVSDFGTPITGDEVQTPMVVDSSAALAGASSSAEGVVSPSPPVVDADLISPPSRLSPPSTLYEIEAANATTTENAATSASKESE